MGRHLPQPLKFLSDLLVSAVLWVYYTLGFAIFFLPRYFMGSFEPVARERRFQRLHNQFFRGFFWLIRTLSPGLRMAVSPAVRALRGAVVVSNHLSLMDPLLLVSLFPAARTIIKPGWLKVPIFGGFLRGGGYIPVGEGAWTGAAAEARRAGLKRHLADGGNLFIFPEGTRSRDGEVGPFRRGAFVLARETRAPVALLRIRGSERLLQRGTFWVNTGVDNPLSIELLGVLEPDYDDPELTAASLAAEAREKYLETRS